MQANPIADEDQLIHHAQKGEEHAFGALLERYYDQIYRFAYRWCGDANNAQDITQQACIKLARNISAFRFESAFSTWLYRLVVNCAKDWRKSEMRFDQPPAEDQDPNAPVETDSSQPSNQESHTLLLQVFTILEGAGKGLKETALLVFAEGLSHKETAEILEISESTVSWRVHEIRKQLQDVMQQEHRS